MNYLAQIGWHGINIMTFRHRGEGLEKCSMQNCLALAGISTLLIGIAFICEGDNPASFIFGIMLHVAYMTFAVKGFSKTRAAGIACLFCVSAFVRMFNATIAEDLVGSRNLVFTLWEMFAMLWFIVKTPD